MVADGLAARETDDATSIRSHNSIKSSKPADVIPSSAPEADIQDAGPKDDQNHEQRRLKEKKDKDSDKDEDEEENEDHPVAIRRSRLSRRALESSGRLSKQIPE